MLVDHRRRIAYCFIPKTGETSWKVVMANNSRQDKKIPSSRDPKGWIHYPNTAKKYGLSLEYYSQKIAQYTKFMVARHPLDRVLSAYYDKAFPHYVRSKKWHSALYGRIVSYAWTQFHSNEGKLDNKYNATFVEFAQFVLKNSDKHWSPYSNKCGQCFIDYDYILRLETMNHDSVQFLSQHYPDVSQLTAYNSMRKTNAAKNIATLKHLGEFKNMDKILVNKFVDRYRLDMELFGYHFDTRTQSAFCSITLPDGNVCC